LGHLQRQALGKHGAKIAQPAKSKVFIILASAFIKTKASTNDMGDSICSISDYSADFVLVSGSILISVIN